MAQWIQMHVSARADYALRAAAELAGAGEVRLKRETIADRQGIPTEFLESILLELKHAGIVQSHRGAAGGFRLGRSPSEISLADVIRAVDGPMSDVRGDRPELVDYPGAAANLKDVWIAIRASLREILEGTSLRDLVDGTLPPRVRELTGDPESWVSLGRIRGSGRLPQPTNGPSRSPSKRKRRLIAH
jgi:Rrf2 family protein